VGNVIDRSQMRSRPVSISVITATFNAGLHLPRLIASLEAQTDGDFTWIIADGASSDNTLGLIEDASKSIDIKVDSHADCGIYDALNHAIQMCDTDYYIVAGADDAFEPDAIRNYRWAAEGSEHDLITSSVRADGVNKPWPRNWEWLYGQFAHVSSHSIGLMVRKDLHLRFGQYRQDLYIAADQKFILDCIHGGAVLRRADFVAGDFTTSGTSGTDVLRSLLEWFAVMVSVGHGLLPQLVILSSRLLRHRARL
jgi:glycosyltransferase involved in cell wall biosynthesis